MLECIPIALRCSRPANFISMFPLGNFPKARVTLAMLPGSDIPAR
jgi:hypothetical protein